MQANPSEVEFLACSKRSDSGERCRVKKAMKSRGGLAFIFSRSFLLRTAPHYLNAWNRLLNSKGPYPSSEIEKKFCRCLLTFYIKREIRYFRVVVVQKRQRNIQKSVLHQKSCCFANYKLLIFLTFSLPSRRWILKSLMYSPKA